MKILTELFDNKYNTAPFSSIIPKDYLPAIKECIKKAKTEIEFITNNTNAPSFKNTIEALDYSGEQLDRVSSIFFNLNSAETNDEIQKIAQEISPLLTEFSNDIRLNNKLFKRVKVVYQKRADLNLTPEQEMLLEKNIRAFPEMEPIFLKTKKMN